MSPTGIIINGVEHVRFYEVPIVLDPDAPPTPPLRQPRVVAGVVTITPERADWLVQKRFAMAERALRRNRTKNRGIPTFMRHGPDGPEQFEPTNAVYVPTIHSLAAYEMDDERVLFMVFEGPRRGDTWLDMRASIMARMDAVIERASEPADPPPEWN